MTPTSVRQPTVGAVAQVLQTVDDPELGLDVVSLGLIYAIDSGEGGIAVDMTVTSSACPMAELLLELAETSLALAFPGSGICLQLLSDPPWDIRMCTREALEALGAPPDYLDRLPPLD